MSSTNLTQPSPLAAAARGRLQFIDIAKGLGILSVILCHIFYQGQPINIFLYAYHMPLFFFVSGMFINSKQSLKTFFVKQLRTIYIPYAAFVYIDFLVRFVLYRASVYSSISVFRLLKNLVGLGDPYFNTPLWFLFSLFLIKMVAFLLHKIPQKTVRQAALGISFALSVAFILVRSRLELPSLNNYLAAIGGYAFFTLGTFLKEPIVTLSKKVSFEKKIFRLPFCCSRGCLPVFSSLPCAPDRLTCITMSLRTRSCSCFAALLELHGSFIPASVWTNCRIPAFANRSNAS